MATVEQRKQARSEITREMSRRWVICPFTKDELQTMVNILDVDPFMDDATAWNQVTEPRFRAWLQQSYQKDMGEEVLMLPLELVRTIRKHIGLIVSPPPPPPPPPDPTLSVREKIEILPDGEPIKQILLDMLDLRRF